MAESLLVILSVDSRAVLLSYLKGLALGAHTRAKGTSIWRCGFGWVRGVCVARF